MHSMKPIVCLLTGIILLGYLWAECLYRITLYFEYGSKPYVNHVGDGYFVSMYSVALVSGVLLGVSLYMSYRLRLRAMTILSVTALLLSLLNVATLAQMNRTKSLVTYSEFVKNMGP